MMSKRSNDEGWKSVSQSSGTVKTMQNYKSA
jgi:hypothetical protein